MPDALLSRQLLATMRFISTPADTRKYGGEAVTTHTIYFQLAPDNKLLMRSNILVSHSDTLDQISKAVRTASEDPILAAFKVEKRTKGYRRIKVTEFLRGDAIGMPPSLKSQFGVSQVNGQLSYIDTIKTFPENTEVRLVRTYYGNQNNTHAGRMTGNVTFGLNLSFVLLPEQPYQRRLFDPAWAISPTTSPTTPTTSSACSLATSLPAGVWSPRIRQPSTPCGGGTS